jgi:hypothetical protein
MEMTTMLTHDDVKALTAPFAADEHEFLKGFTYLTEQAVTTRLDEVDPSWSFQITNVEHKGESVTVYGALTVCGVTRQSCGMDKPRNPNSEVEKGAVTDALKRCARLFGVGRYILDIPDNVKDDRALARWLGDTPPAAPTAAAKPNGKKADAPTHKETADFMLEPYVEAGIGKSGKPYIRFEITGKDEYVYAFTRDAFRQAGWYVDAWTHEGETGRTAHDLAYYPRVTAERDGEMWKIIHVTPLELCDAVEMGKTA